MKRFTEIFVSWRVLAMFLPGPALAATIVVDPGGGGDHREIQAAIDAARAGDTVLVKPGEYLIEEPITFRGKNITVRAEGGPEATTIRMAEVPSDPARPWTVVFESGEGPEAVLDGFTLTGPGTGLVSTAGSAPTVSNCTIATNIGAGVSVGEGSSLTLIDSRVVRNAGKGIDASTGASVTVEGCSISGNSGHGIDTDGGTVTIRNSTIAENSKTGLYSYSGNTRFDVERSTIAGNGECAFRRGTRVFLSSCIVWGNAGGLLADRESVPAVAIQCCIQGTEGYHGIDNISEDPLFCGWVGESEVFVDASRPGPGDGTQPNPYRDLRSALEGYSFALSAGSPCIGSGEGGGNMGADHGVCGSPPTASRTVHLAPGAYSLEGKALTFHVSLEGAGQDQTVIEGTVGGLRTGSSLRSLTVTTGGLGEVGISIARGEAPEVSSTTIVGGTFAGISCDRGSSPTFTDCTVREGGAGVVCSGSSATFRRCKIVGNKTGIACDDRGADSCGGPAGDLFEGCMISDNLGPGVACEYGGAPTLTSCLISGNEGHGVVCEIGSAPVLKSCTIAGNYGADKDGAASAGVCLYEGSVAFLESSIVWGNAGGTIVEEPHTLVGASFSCLEGPGVWPGQGNIAQDPLFCAWGSKAEVWVDASKPGPGDGSQGSPYPDLESALGFSFALSAGSPCIGAGAGGASMGADLGVCDAPGETTRLVHLASGNYGLEGRSLASHVSLEGSGEEETVIEGTVAGLRTGAKLSGLTVTNGRFGGIVVATGDAPEISRATISGNDGDGVSCAAGSSPRIEGCTIEGSSRCGLSSAGASPTLVGCTIRRNGSAGNASGGASLEGGSATLVDCEIIENLGSLCGGIHAQGSSLDIIRCSIAGNVSDSSPAVRVEACSGQVASCRIEGNWGQRFGDGVVTIVSESGLGEPLEFLNCTIAGNWFQGDWTTSEHVGGVGGVDVVNCNTTRLGNCTISGNAAARSGGMRCYNASPIVTNCIIWGNTPNTVCGTRSHCLTRSSDDPLFVSPGVFDFTRFKTVTVAGEEVTLPDFIVEEPDFRLRAGSPAIDAGAADGTPETDIEGNPRPCGAGVDIGAYELCEGSGGTAFRRGDANADGAVDISDPVAILNHLFSTKALFCFDAADADSSGVLELSDAVSLLGYLFLGTAPPPEPFGECGVAVAQALSLGCEKFKACP